MKKIMIDDIVPESCPVFNYSCLRCQFNQGIIEEPNAQLRKDLKVKCCFDEDEQEESALTVNDYIEINK